MTSDAADKYNDSGFTDFALHAKPRGGERIFTLP
jgi:hypothetical protein